MNRRSFIKRSFMLTGLVLLKPVELLSYTPKIKEVVTPSRVNSWKERILKLYPEGTTPLTEIIKMMNKTKRSDPEFSWWTK